MGKGISMKNGGYVVIGSCTELANGENLLMRHAVISSVTGRKVRLFKAMVPNLRAEDVERERATANHIKAKNVPLTKALVMDIDTKDLLTENALIYTKAEDSGHGIPNIHQNQMR